MINVTAAHTHRYMYPTENAAVLLSVSVYRTPNNNSYIIRCLLHGVRVVIVDNARGPVYIVF
jgi:hypothetical protein